MRRCLGKTDRVLRVLIGAIALVVGLAEMGSVGAGWAYLADAVGVIGLATGTLGWCPLYALFGLQGCKKTA